MANFRRWQNVRITARDLEGRVLDVREVRNLITTVGLNMVRDFFAGDVTDGVIRYIAIGTDSTAPALANTALGAEIFRKAVTSTSKPGAGQYKTVWYIAPSEAVAAIEEIGWFAGRDLILTEGSDAITTEGSDRLIREGVASGLMIARLLYSRNKTNIESLSIERVERVEEA